MLNNDDPVADAQPRHEQPSLQPIRKRPVRRRTQERNRAPEPVPGAAEENHRKLAVDPELAASAVEAYASSVGKFEPENAAAWFLEVSDQL